MKRSRFPTWVGCVLALMLAAGGLSGCQRREPPSPPARQEFPSPQEDPSGSEAELPDGQASPGLLEVQDLSGAGGPGFPARLPEDASPQVVWPQGDWVTLYRYDVPSEQYAALRLSVPQEPVTLHQLAQLALELDGGGSLLTVLSVRQEKGMAVVDLRLKEGADAPLEEGETARRILNSVGRSLLETQNRLESVGFTLEGGAFSAGGISLEGDGYGHYDPAPLYAKVSEEEYRKLREALPYPGMRRDLPQAGSLPFYDQAVPPEDRPEGLELLLSHGGDPGEEGLQGDFLIARALEALLPVNTDPTYREYGNYHPQAAPIAQAVGDSQLIPREWVEETIRQLYGPQILLPQHRSQSKWLWHPKEGVYTPPHMGIPGNTQPYILAVEQREDGYLVELVYLRFGPNGYLDEDGQLVDYPFWGEDSPRPEEDPQLLSLLRERLPRRLAGVGIGPDGSLFLRWVAAKDP